MHDSESNRYPIGRYVRPSGPIGAGRLAELIDDLATLPQLVRDEVRGVSSEQLDTPYRAGGWTARQVIHHLPDSHMNAYVRMKLAVTEDRPAVRPYDEVRWAELPEAREGDIALSLDLLDALHRRWVSFLRALRPEQFARVFVHSDLGDVPVYEAVDHYAWHGRHHLAHIGLALSHSRPL